MLVLNTTSPSDSPSAPNDQPSKTVPSSSARTAFLRSPMTEYQAARPVADHRLAELLGRGDPQTTVAQTVRAREQRELRCHDLLALRVGSLEVPTPADAALGG